MKIAIFSIPLFCLLIATCGHLAAAGDVVVALHQSSPAVSESTVRIGDIASVIGGAASDRRYIEQLDLESLRDQHDCSITRKQVEMRLLLAGYKRNAFDITGPPTVTARRSSPAQLRGNLERLLESELGQHYAINSDRIAVRLTVTPQLESLEKKLTTNGYVVELVPRNDFPLGRTRLAVEIIDATGRRYSQLFDAQVSLSMKVAIASQPIAQGTVLTPAMLRLVDRAITEKADYANPENASGRTANRYIASNSILLTNHLVGLRAGSSQAVQRNDLIDVVINIGRGEIRLKNARAMESGKIGDMIEVLNPQTNGRINASIIGPKLATVSSRTRR